MLFLDAIKSKISKQELKKKCQDLGLSSSPYFAEALFYSFTKANISEEEFLEALKNVIVGVDNLHNVRGWILHLISVLKEDNRLNEEKYNSLLKQFGLSPDDCSGGKLRLLILNFEKILLPSLVYDSSNQLPITESLREVLEIFRTIVWVAYSPPDAQTYDGIKLLLRYKCFQLTLALQKLPTSLKLVDLYLHVILSHFPDFFDYCSFFIPSTEPLEGLFVTTKRTKHSTNRQKKNILKKIMKRFENLHLKDIVLNDDPKSYLDSITRDTEYKLKNKFSSYRNILRTIKDVSIEIPAENDHGLIAQQTRAFLSILKENVLYKNHLVVKDGSVLLKIRDDLITFLSKHENIDEISN